jgi:hypothetical protein
MTPRRINSESSHPIDIPDKLSDKPPPRLSLLLTHLYSFFGALLGCTQLGDAGFPAYSGEASMYSVHSFMDLNMYQVTYFIEQVGLAAESFGVTKDDATAVGAALSSLFGVRCAPPTTVIPAAGPVLQAICIDGDCPLSPNATCAAYMPAVAPVNATSNMTATAPGSFGTATMAPSGSMSMGASGTGSMSMGASGSASTSAPGTASTAGAPGAMMTGLSLAAVAGGFAVLML